MSDDEVVKQPPAPEVRVGDKVKHSHFEGVGRIAALQNDEVVAVVEVPREIKETQVISGSVQIIQTDGKTTVIEITKIYPETHSVRADEVEIV